MILIQRITFFLLLISINCINAQDLDSSSFSEMDNALDLVKTNSLFDDLQSSEIVEMRIFTDLNQLLSNKKTNEYSEALCLMIKADGQRIKQDIKIRARGKTRRRLCSFPPLKLKFKKSKLATAGFQPYKSLKLVTHCSNDVGAEENVIKEYLAYKMYNLVSNYGFRTQLVKVTYVDVNDSSISYTRFGFLIESEKELGERYQIKSYDKFGLSFSNIGIQQGQIFSMFQYMIGNADWQLMTNHNVKSFESRDSGKVIVVPYDFDFSGLVDANYALPNPDYPQKDVKDRIYIGGEEPILPETIQLFKDKQSEFKAFIEAFEPLSRSQKKEILSFIDSFYKKLDNISSLERF